MNSSFVVISKLIKSIIGEKCLVNFPMNVSVQSLRDYLECVNIYKGNSPKKKNWSYWNDCLWMYYWKIK